MQKNSIWTEIPFNIIKRCPWMQRLLALSFGAFLFIVLQIKVSMASSAKQSLCIAIRIWSILAYKAMFHSEFFQQTHNILDNITRTLGSPWVVNSNKQQRWCREWKQKWGCRAALPTRLKRQPHKPSLPRVPHHCQILIRKMDNSSNWQLCPGLLGDDHDWDLAPSSDLRCSRAACRTH